MARKGKKVCWDFKGGRYCGTLLPGRETSTHRYARTKNGKIKSLPKNKQIWLVEQKKAK